MPSSLKPGFTLPDSFINNRGTSPASIGTLQFKDPDSKLFWGRTYDSSLDPKGASDFSIRTPNFVPIHAHASVTSGKSAGWWEKSPQPNMIDISSPQELLDSLLNAGDKLVIIDFYWLWRLQSSASKDLPVSRIEQGCPFLKVNYEEHKKMCHALHVHVLPFFRFYRGAEGRVCSFSCTNATIKKFRAALAKYGTDRCSLAPTRGLGESELVALASVGLISTGNASGETALGHRQHTYAEADFHGHGHGNAIRMKGINGVAMAAN